MTPCFRFPRITAREYFFGFYKANIKAVRNSHGHKDRKPALMPFWQTASKRMPLIRLVYHHIIHLPLLPHDLKRCPLKTSWHKHQKSIYHLPYVRLKGFILFHCLHNSRAPLVVQGDYFPPFRRLA